MAPPGATADVLVVGAGMAGAAAAWWLAGSAAVVLVEAEPAPGVHATGRSAAVLTTTTGSERVRALTEASRPFFLDPGDGFSDVPLCRPRSVLRVAASDPWPGTVALSPAEARSLVPVLRPAAARSAVLEPGGLDLDVDATLQGFLRGVRRRGGAIRTGTRAVRLERRGDGWRVHTGDEAIDCAVVVDAAGAWADEVAVAAGLSPVGLEPQRRTAFLFRPPGGIDVSPWPLVMDGDESWYVKPDAGLLLGSGADATPSEPCDARPEEIDVALGIDRVTTALDVEIRSIVRAWAGLRTFAPDRDPVVGPDPTEPSFVWLAGQGGYGIKTAPELGRLAAEAALGRPTPLELSPARFADRAGDVGRAR